MEDNSLLRAKLDKKGVPEKEYYEIQTEKGYSKYRIYTACQQIQTRTVGNKFQQI